MLWTAAWFRLSLISGFGCGTAVPETRTLPVPEILVWFCMALFIVVMLAAERA